MQGTLSIYQGYFDGDAVDINSTPTLQESNLVVDGMKEHIVDMLTRIPAPSSLSADVSASYEASNFTIQGFTLSPNRSAFERVHALGGLSGYFATGSTTAPYRNADPSDGSVYAYNADIPNHQFSSVNVSGGISPNGQLYNPSFSSTEPYLSNGKFRNYFLDETLSGVHMNEILGLYELNDWDIFSFLRYDTSAAEFLDTLELGSCSRYNLEEVSGIYSSLSGTTASATFGAPDDGILYIRAFEPTLHDTSGNVGLKQTFSIRNPSILSEALVDGTDNVLAEITAQFSSVSGGANARIHLNVRDETVGENYNFSATTGLVRNSWGGSGAPLVLNALKDVSGTVSEFINIPSSKVNHTFTVSFDFYCHDASDILKCYFWNANVNLLSGWYWGNIFSGQSMHRVWENDYRNPALFIDAENSVDLVPSGTTLDQITYLAQPFKMDPLKKYSVITAFSSTAEFTQGSDAISTAVVKRFSSDVSSLAGYNHLSTSGGFPLQETRLPSNFAFSPEYPPTSPPNSVDLQSATVRPSDLCLEVSGGATVSGTFTLSSHTPAILTGEVIKTFQTGVSATDKLKMSIRTVGRSLAGTQRWFNFNTGDWEVSSATTSADIYLESSSIQGFGFAGFQSSQITTDALTNIVALNVDGRFDLILSLDNSGAKTAPAFVKNLRINSYPKTLAQDSQEAFNFTTVTPKECWQTLTNSGASILSGLSNGFIVSSYTNATTTLNRLGTYPIEAMYTASGSTHASDSDYRVYMMQSTATAPSPAGKAYKFNLINIVDDALVAATVEAPPNIITSETYVNTQRFDIMNQPFLEWTDTDNVYPTVDYIHPGVCLQTPAKPAAGGTLNQSNASLILGTILGPGGGQAPTCSLSYVESLEDIVLPVSATDRSFSFDYNMNENNVNPAIRWRACATTKDNDIVWWDGATSSWDEYELSARPVNGFLDGNTLQRGDEDNVKIGLSTKYDITNERFDATTKIKTSLLMYSWDAADVISIQNWKFYTNGPFPAMDMPEFPAPNQTTVQPPVATYAELGHYTNQIALRASLSAINLDRAFGNINWAPSAGLQVSGSPCPSYLNWYDVINSDGYVLFGYNGPLTPGGKPFYVNGFNAAPTASSMVYTLDVSSTELDYFQMQGGVGAMGLHTFNVNATYRKLKTNGFDLSAIYDTSAATTSNLYNLSDVTRNPVFRLATKKVFRTPLSFTTGANTFIRLVWEINFI